MQGVSWSHSTGEAFNAPCSREKECATCGLGRWRCGAHPSRVPATARSKSLAQVLASALRGRARH
eukprot:15431823-Alexandrium_andersonii.AAC.1